MESRKFKEHCQKTGEAISKLNLDRGKDESEQQPRKEFPSKFNSEQAKF